MLGQYHYICKEHYQYFPFHIYIYVCVSCNKCTLRISGEIELGPLEEKGATTGAGDFPITVLLCNICTTGFLHGPHRFCVSN